MTQDRPLPDWLSSRPALTVDSAGDVDMLGGFGWSAGGQQASLWVCGGPGALSLCFILQLLLCWDGPSHMG